jgi:hypothetical protein
MWILKTKRCLIFFHEGRSPSDAMRELLNRERRGE